MELRGLHLLLTYQCLFECDHCFVWGGPRQSGTLTLAQVHDILEQAKDLGTVQWIYFEGGEPFLYYATLLAGVREAAGMGFRVGVVSNGYWATSVDDARKWLRPLAGLVQDLTLSDDLYHYDPRLDRQPAYARAAAEQLGFPLGVINVAQPEAACGPGGVGQLPEGESAVMYRGRAAEALAARASRSPWESFTACLHEELREPRRAHVDPLGNLHVCQGISVGNLFARTLRAICADYAPAAHPIIGPLLAGGPAELVRRYDLSPAEGYADACHLCYEARRRLRGRFPEELAPDQAYGVSPGGAPQAP